MIAEALKNKNQELRKLKETCVGIERDASAALRAEANRVQGEVRALEAALRLERAKEFNEIAGLISEMAHLAFAHFIATGFDLRFKVTHHVNVIEMRDFRTDYDAFETKWFFYSDDGAPDVEGTRRAMTYLKEAIAETGGES